MLNGDSPPDTEVASGHIMAQPKKRSRPEKINYPTKRVLVACEVCRARKTRCDAARPTCSFCAEVGARCNYRKRQSEERLTEKPLIPAPPPQENDIINRLQRIETLLQGQRGHDIVADLHGLPVGPFEERSIIIPASPLLHRPYYNHHRPLTVGFSLSGLSRLANSPCPPSLEPLCYNDYEEQLELNFIAGEKLFGRGPALLDSLNLNSRRCWQLQQIFSKDVLPWCPIIDQQEVIKLVSRTVEKGFDPGDLETCLALLIFALGGFAEGSHYLGDDPDHFPGIDCFRVACQLVDADRSSSNTILWVQCRILISFYLFYSLRPIQAFENTRPTALKIIFLLQMRNRIKADAHYRESCHRAFWACYLLEHELQYYVPFSGMLLQNLSGDVPLPTSDYEEPGIYWFLSEIAIRRIFSRQRHGEGPNMRIIYEPVIADEIAAQMMTWQTSLPHPIKFPLDDSVHLKPLLDPHKVFLRAQYYAINAVLYWQYVVRLLTDPIVPPLSLDSPQNSDGDTNFDEYIRVRDAAAESLRYAVMHAFAVESLFQNRHLMLMANFQGLCGLTTLLLCTYDVPELEDIQPPQRKQAIITAWRCLKNLEANPPFRKRVERVEELMKMKGIEAN